MEVQKILIQNVSPMLYLGIFVRPFLRCHLAKQGLHLPVAILRDHDERLSQVSTEKKPFERLNQLSPA
jgi:hypothetical protein